MQVLKLHKIKLVTLFIALLPLGALGGQPYELLRLSATVKDGELVAKLTNSSDQFVRIVGNVVSPIPGFGGFYVELYRENGSPVKYCGMIDGAIPKVQRLQPGMSIIYRDTVFSITNQSCLASGTYTGRVVYYNSVAPEAMVYSRPVCSDTFEIDIGVGYKEVGAKVREKGDGED